MRVWVQLYSGEERTYENVTRIDGDDRYTITICGHMGILAIINKGDIRNLLSEQEEIVSP